MAKSSHKHPLLRLGKGPVKKDVRNLQFAAIRKRKITVPKEYDFDAEHPGIPARMYMNDAYGCCVISGRANQTQRFELKELAKMIKITDLDVKRQYFKESGGEDSGLVMLNSMNSWRRKGWLAAGRRLFISLYSQVQPRDHASITQCIYSGLGLQVGADMPVSASAQFDRGQPWDVVGGSNGVPGSWGGHCVYIVGYTAKGPVCWTWARKQQMTWKWFDKYVSEVYLPIDAVDTTKKRKLLDMSAINDFMRSHVVHRA